MKYIVFDIWTNFERRAWVSLGVKSWVNRFKDTRDWSRDKTAEPLFETAAKTWVLFNVIQIVCSSVLEIELMRQ